MHHTIGGAAAEGETTMTAVRTTRTTRAPFGPATRALGLTGAATVLALGLSACGGSTQPSGGGTSATTTSTPAATTDAAATTAAVGSTVDGGTLAQEIQAAATAKNTVAGKVTLMGMTSTSVADYAKKASKGSMTMAGKTLEYVVIGDQYYVKDFPSLPAGWVKVDKNSTNPAAKSLATQLGAASQADLTALTRVLSGQQATVKGQEKVGETDTTHYAMTISPADYAKGLGGSQAEAIKATLKDPVAVDYWLSADHLPQKMTTGVKVNGQQQVTTMTFSDWGKPVTIEAPAGAKSV